MLGLGPVGCRTLRRNCTHPTSPGRVHVLTPRHTRRDGLRHEKRPAAMLLHGTPRVFLLRVRDSVMPRARERPIAAGGIRLQPAARVDGAVRGLLPRRAGAIAGRLADDRALATDPGDAGRSVGVLRAPTGLPWLAAPPRAASHGLFSAVCGLALLAGGVLQRIRRNRVCQLAVHVIGQRSMAPPPTPPSAGPAVEAPLPGHAPRCTGQTQEKGGHCRGADSPCTKSGAPLADNGRCPRGRRRHAGTGDMAATALSTGDDGEQPARFGH
jgi:hypothetical protein